MPHDIPAKLTKSREDALITTILHTFNGMAAQKDLSPRNPVVNEMLTNYVGQIIEAEDAITDAAGILNNKQVKRIIKPLRSLLASAEFEMESYFANDFAGAGRLSQQDLSRFWYRDNYKALVDIELKGIADFSAETDYLHDPRPIAFVGSGPLPLSAIDYCLATGRSCDCVELSESAVGQSRQLIENLGLQDKVHVIHQDGRNVDYNAYGVVFVAALVPQKKEVLTQIRNTASDAIIGVRSAEGLIELLYTPVKIEEVESQGFKHCGTTHSTPEAVNSTCFFTTTGGPR